MSAQKENGYTAIANEIMDELVKYRLPGEQMQCLLFILRKTYGYNKKTDAISLSQFVKATGINRGNVVRAIKGLLSKNLIYVKKGGVKKDTISISKYRFNKRFESWLSGVKKDTGSVNIDRKVVSKKTHTKDIITKDKELYSPNFLTFWKAYPKKEKKKAAFTAYKKIQSPKPSLQIVLTSIEAHKKLDQWMDRQFIPLPATFLNARQWEDELENTPSPISEPIQIKTPGELLEDFRRKFA